MKMLRYALSACALLAVAPTAAGAADFGPPPDRYVERVVPPPPAYYPAPYYPRPYYGYYYGPRPYPYYAAYPYWGGPRFAYYGPGRYYWGGRGRRW